MLKIYLARHGQNVDNANGILNGHRDEPLTDKGLEQAHELARNILSTHIRFDHLYSSPLRRAYQTAEAVTDALGMAKPEIMQELIERDFGVMTGKPQADIKELCGDDVLQTDTITYFLTPEGAETFPQLLERAHKLIEMLKANHPDGNILLVSHGDFGKMIYASYYNLDWVNVLKMFHFGNSELLELSEKSGPDETHVFKFEQHNL